MNILHTFVTCSKVKTFWQQLQKLMVECNIQTHDSLSTEVIIFGSYKYARFDILNHVLLHAKHYLHRKTLDNSPPNAQQFMKHYKQKVLIEKEIFTARDKMKEFQIRFGTTTLLDVT